MCRSLAGSYTPAVDGRSSAITMRTVAETLRICAPTVVEALFGRVRREVCDRRLKRWAARAIAIAQIDLEVRGDGAIPPHETFVVMSNHQSLYDTFVMQHSYPGTLRMVAKEEVFRLPLIGRAMVASEFIGVSRGKTSSARKVLKVAKKRLASGVSVWIAPEGTRSVDGSLGDFKKGGFLMAKTAGCRILPVTIDGTLAILPPSRLRPLPGCKVRVTYHPPVDPRAFNAHDREGLRGAVKDAISSSLPRAGEG